MAPLTRELCYGTPYSALKRFPVSVEDLNRFLLRRTNHTGSDIRVVTGEVMNPKTFPRQAVCSKWWKWEPCFHFRWKRPEHINSLELENVLLSLKHYVTHQHVSQCRLFHITDSYACMSVISKGRSSSKILLRKLRVLSSYLLGFDFQLVVGHVDSADNPTDAVSGA